MPCSVRYGVDSELRLPLEPDELASGSILQSSPKIDIRPATEAALAAPLEYPPLAQAVVSGDHVTIAVDRFVPQAEVVAAVIVERLLECGVEPEQVTIVIPEGRTFASLPIHRTATVPPAAAMQPAVRIETHNPDDRGHLCFLANTKSGRPIYLNRLVGDADLVILVGVARRGRSWSYRGPFGAVYPTFSDRDTQKRFRNPHLLDSHSDTFLKSQQEVDAVGWQLGAQFLVEVVPAAGDEAARIVAGEASAVQRSLDAADAASPQPRGERSVKVAVAALTGRESQTWDRLAATLAMVAAEVDDGGAVALCTDLEEPPGPALQLLAQCGDDRDETLAHIARERPSDLFAALTLADVQHRVRVYLLSKLDPSTVEDLGMTPLAGPDEVGRLAKRRGTCLVVADAQWASFDGPTSASSKSTDSA